MARTIMVSGVCGTGKTEITLLGYHRLTEALGSTASIDTDRLYMMLDPHWVLPYEERRSVLALRQVGLLAGTFLDYGVDTVLIVGNALCTTDGLDLILPGLLSRGEVFHVFLDPTVAEVIERLRRRGDRRSDAWVQEQVDGMRSRHGPWTARIDNSAMTPEETLEAIARAAASGEGRLRAPFGPPT